MMMRRFIPSLSTLTAFEAAARHLNFTRAAMDLGLTQSGVSRQIKILEAFLGLSLFDRVGPRLILTDAGQSYAAEVAQILEDLEKVSIDVVRGWKAEKALLIGALSSMASRWLAPRMDRFSRQFPTTFFEITPTFGDIDFADTALDVALLRGRGNWKAAQAAHLFDERVVVVASPSLIPTGTVLDPDQFRGFTQLQNSGRPDSWLKWLQQTGQKRSGLLQGPRLGNTSMLINAAISGIGIAIVPVCMIERELQTGVLHTPFGPSVLSGDVYYAVFPERKAHLTTVLNFRDWLLAETRSLRRA